MGPRDLAWLLFGLVVGAMLVAVALDVIGDALGRGDAVTAVLLGLGAVYGAWRLGRAIRCQIVGSVSSSD